MTKNLREKPRTLSSWNLLEYKISGCTDARFLVQVTQEWNRLSQNPQNWSLLQALEKVRIIVVPFFFNETQVNKPAICSKFLPGAKGLIYPEFFLAGVCNVKQLIVLLLSLGLVDGMLLPPPPSCTYALSQFIDTHDTHLYS